jgi:hypothetical protein
MAEDARDQACVKHEERGRKETKDKFAPHWHAAMPSTMLSLQSIGFTGQVLVLPIIGAICRRRLPISINSSSSARRRSSRRRSSARTSGMLLIRLGLRPVWWTPG